MHYNHIKYSTLLASIIFLHVYYLIQKIFTSYQLKSSTLVVSKHKVAVYLHEWPCLLNLLTGCFLASFSHHVFTLSLCVSLWISLATCARVRTDAILFSTFLPFWRICWRLQTLAILSNSVFAILFYLHHHYSSFCLLTFFFALRQTQSWWMCAIY